MKIDFHCHTLKTKKDELETRNVGLETFKEKVLLSGVKIIVITNHNLFEKERGNMLKPYFISLEWLCYTPPSTI